MKTSIIKQALLVACCGLIFACGGCEKTTTQEGQDISSNTEHSQKQKINSRNEQAYTDKVQVDENEDNIERAPKTNEADKQCSSDKECFLVPESGCFPCQGGTDIAMNMNAAKKFMMSRKDQCMEKVKQMKEPPKAGCRPFDAVCESGTCVAKTLSEAEIKDRMPPQGQGRPEQGPEENMGPRGQGQGYGRPSYRGNTGDY